MAKVRSLAFSVDSCLWWILLLRAYVKATGDIGVINQFPNGNETDPRFVSSASVCHILPVLDGSFMIDRRMGVGGHPLEIQVLFYAALRTAKELLLQNGGERYLDAVNQRWAL